MTLPFKLKAQNSCHYMTPPTNYWMKVKKVMLAKRVSAASIVIGADGRTLWVTGGRAGTDKSLKSTELVSI